MENNKYSLLLIAFDCHYSHVTRFIKFLKSVNPLVSISLFADKDDSDISEEIKKNVEEIIIRRRYDGRAFIRFKPFCRLMNKVVLNRQLKMLAKYRRFDIVNIHFCLYYMSYYLRHLRKMGNKIIISPWGSDVLRLDSKVKLKMLGRVYRKADMITVGSKGPIGKIALRQFGVKESKLCAIGWGSETIDYINANIEGVSKADAKKELGLDDSYVITCGYNAFQEQRHETILDAIGKIKEDLPRNMILLFPVTYGVSNWHKKNAYVQSIKTKAASLNLNAVFYEEYLSVRDTFILRRASDMFIHVQTTDAGNSTIMEYCICGSKIIHGNWMHYKWLDYQPMFYFPVDDLNNLSSVILNAYHSELPEIPKEVISVIRARGWKEKMVQWNNAFMGLLQFD